VIHDDDDDDVDDDDVPISPNESLPSLCPAQTVLGRPALGDLDRIPR